MKSKFFLLGAHISVAFNVINGEKAIVGMVYLVVCKVQHVLSG